MSGHVYYADYLAALGHPEHHILLGIDWWGCLCGQVGLPNPLAPPANPLPCRAQSVEVDYEWSDVADVAGSVADLHQWLWESEAFA